MIKCLYDGRFDPLVIHYCLFISGHFSDPDNLFGLAHFCEHILFLGTEKVRYYGTYFTCERIVHKKMVSYTRAVKVRWHT